MQSSGMFLLPGGAQLIVNFPKVFISGTNSAPGKAVRKEELRGWFDTGLGSRLVACLGGL